MARSDDARSGRVTGAERDIMREIDDLIDEERALRERSEARMGLSTTERSRLSDVEVQLDRCWDLLRQRRAHTEFGQDPRTARTRSASQVEDYEN
jgi:Protein of unknown function (DUF2630)